MTLAQRWRYSNGPKRVWFETCIDLNAYIIIKMESSDLESDTKVVQNKILNKINTTYFQLGHGIEMGVAFRPSVSGS